MATTNKAYPAVKEDLMQKLKKLYPESRSLDVDREYNAKEVLQPTEVGIKEWAKNPKRKDLAGFDSRINPREPSVKAVLRSGLTGGAPRYIADQSEGDVAPDKFAREDFEAGRLIKEQQAKIKDFDSMKSAITTAWRRDRGLTELIDTMKEDDWRVMWNHPTIQHYFDRNTRPLITRYLMLKFHVEPARASTIMNKMNPRMRSNLVRKLRTDYVNMIVKGIKMPTTYNRARWTTEEKTFVRANLKLPSDEVARAYASAFNKRRTINSIKYQQRRLKRKS
ncbi:MAG: hypothetical protein MUP55_01710 [Candidatus Aenigmarchaeota archaeon]|nr:hypothetical protein [Candidatus Aenigmarchaeota archaeon]